MKCKITGLKSVYVDYYPEYLEFINKYQKQLTAKVIQVIIEESIFNQHRMTLEEKQITGTTIAITTYLDITGRSKKHPLEFRQLVNMVAAIETVHQMDKENELDKQSNLNNK